MVTLVLMTLRARDQLVLQSTSDLSLCTDVRQCVRLKNARCSCPGDKEGRPGKEYKLGPVTHIPAVSAKDT